MNTFSLFIIPKYLAILFETMSVCAFQVKFSLCVIPTKLNVLIMKKHYINLVLFLFKDNLLYASQ